MNINEIKKKCEELLKKTELYSAEHAPKLKAAFERSTIDMRMNIEFFPDKARVFCYERGQLVCEWRASETEVIFLVTNDVLYRIVMEIVMREENLIKRADRKYFNTDLEISMMDKAFDEIGGVYNEMRRDGFGMFKLKPWESGLE